MDIVIIKWNIIINWKWYSKYKQNKLELSNLKINVTFKKLLMV